MLQQQLNKNSKASIINLFEKMDSNITKFRASVVDSPKQFKIHCDQKVKSCNCLSQNKYRKIEGEFYNDQEELVRKASEILKIEGNQTFAKLLCFMQSYITKIVQLLSKEVLCDCIKNKIEINVDLNHKISFLREQNHKFFKIIQQKSQECEELKQKIQHLEEKILSARTNETPIASHLISQLPFASELQSELTSRIISSSTSRVSQFKHGWPDSTLPFGQIGHKKYFQELAGQKNINYLSREALKQRTLNNTSSQSNNPFQNTFRKTKIFQKH